MSKFVIEGGKPLNGSITVPGNKNAVLPAMAAAILTDEPVVLTNVPQIRDVKTMGLLLQDLGASVSGTKTRSLSINAARVSGKNPDEKLVADLRASVLLLGPLLARFGNVTVRHPGGDIIGRRSIDVHLAGLAQLGATVRRSGMVNTVSASGLHGARIYLSEASVTATENIMMAAVLAQGETVILNAASEPHVRCLGWMLEQMGAKIRGYETNRITIRGVKKLRGATHRIRPDHIEAGTWAIAAAATGGGLAIHAVVEEDWLPIRHVLESMGVTIETFPCSSHARDGEICVRARRGTLRARGIKTGLWPGFPTDLMSPLLVLATQAPGSTLAHDWMYEGRMFFVDRLIKMGADVVIADPHRVIVNGPTPLFGRRTSSPDIRAGIALIIAALIAHGTSEINMIELVDRGYERLDSRLTALGARLTRVN